MPEGGGAEGCECSALVLAAGKSTRISEWAGGVPKPLLEIGGRTLLEWNLEWLASYGVASAWVNLHYGAALIRDALENGNRSGVEIRFSFEEELLGTAGAWKKLDREWGETSLVVYGDNLTRFDLTRFLDAHLASGSPATVALFDASRHLNTGIAGGRAEMAGDGRVVAFREGGADTTSDATSAPSLVNAGVYLLERAVTDRIGPGFQDFAVDVFPRLLDTGELRGCIFEDDGFCLGVDTPERFMIARRLIESGQVAL